MLGCQDGSSGVVRRVQEQLRPLTARTRALSDAMSKDAAVDAPIALEAFRKELVARLRTLAHASTSK